MIETILRSDWIVLLIVGVILLLASEFGFRIGLRHTPQQRAAHRSQTSTLQGAMLGLLGLLLGFTFAMAVGRYETRKQLLLDESNAIGTVWLRASLLSDTARDRIRPALMDYIDSRLLAADATVGSQPFLAQVARSEHDQAAMWHATVAEVNLDDSPAASLFTDSLNALIDLDSKRQAASRNHVPPAVWLLLIIVAFTVCWTTGYSTALGEGGWHALSMVILPILLTIVITVIADLDNPRRGLIKISQQGLIDLRATLKKYQ